MQVSGLFCMPFSEHLYQWLCPGGLMIILLFSLLGKSFGRNICGCEILGNISWMLSGLSLVIPSSQTFQCARWLCSNSFAIDWVSIKHWFQILFGTAWVTILPLFGMDQAHFTCHHCGMHAGLLDVHCMLGELTVWDHSVCMLALLDVCMMIHQ